MLRNALYKRVRLCGGDGQIPSVRLQTAQKRRNARVHARFKQSDCAVALPIQLNGLFRFFVVHAANIAKSRVNRRPYEFEKFLRIGLFETHFIQRILHAGENALLALNDRTVKIKYDIFRAHPHFPPENILIHFYYSTQI